jgi:hypothetical protein
MSHESHGCLHGGKFDLHLLPIQAQKYEYGIHQTAIKANVTVSRYGESPRMYAATRINAANTTETLKIKKLALVRLMFGLLQIISRFQYFSRLHLVVNDN